MSSKLPVLFSLTGTDTPLDLSVKKTEMDSQPPHQTNLEYPAFSGKTPIRSASLPQNLDYLQIYADQRPVFGENLYSDHQSFYSLASESNADGKRSHSSPGFQSGGEGLYVENPRPSVSPNFDYESGILPKKRKNLWRPYDSRAKMDENDKDSDSSDSNMSSDHEFRVPLTPPPPSDPIKKRKFDMLRYADSQSPEADTMRTHSPENHVTFSKDGGVDLEGNGYVDMGSHPDNSSGESGINEALAKAQMSLVNNFPESREKIISGMKKRDIFGWSIKLSGGAESVESIKETGNCLDTVCKDGEKTYFELQTVKKSPVSNNSEIKTDTSQREMANAAKPASRSPSSHKQDSSPTKPSSQTPINVNKQKLKNESNKENSDTLVGKKVIIYGKDNSIEAHDESSKVTNKKSDTYKGLSLIDLIEEIEADALKEDKVQSEKERQIKNRRVAALLKQCNHVKLTALDFLMSNVIIEDTEQKRNTKNANIQKMLNGDKINSVSLLDIMEMQVEVGLS